MILDRIENIQQSLVQSYSLIDSNYQYYKTVAEEVCGSLINYLEYAIQANPINNDHLFEAIIPAFIPLFKLELLALQYNPECPALLYAFDHNILNSGLPIQMDAKEDYKIIDSIQITEQMKQFIFLLKIYRSCLEIYEILYHLKDLLKLGLSNSETYFLGHEFTQNYNNETLEVEDAALTQLFDEAKELQNSIKCSHQILVKKQLEFENKYPHCILQLTCAFETFRKRIQEGRKDFVNQFYLSNDRWHILLNNLEKKIYYGRLPPNKGWFFFRQEEPAVPFHKALNEAHHVFSHSVIRNLIKILLERSAEIHQIKFQIREQKKQREPLSIELK